MSGGHVRTQLTGRPAGVACTRRTHILKAVPVQGSQERRQAARRSYRWCNPVLRQNSIGAIRVDTLLPDVALFLPFRSNNERQTAASGDTKRRSTIARFCERWRTIRQRPAHGRKGRLTFLVPPVNRRVAGSNLPAAAVAAGYAAAPCSWCRNARTSSWSAIRERADARRIRREDTSTDHRPAAYRSAAVTSIITTGTDSSAGTPSRAAPRWRTATV